MHSGSIKALKHVQKVTTDGERPTAAVAAELIKKQDHTPVQSSAGAERGLQRASPSTRSFTYKFFKKNL